MARSLGPGHFYLRWLVVPAVIAVTVMTPSVVIVGIVFAVPPVLAGVAPFMPMVIVVPPAIAIGKSQVADIKRQSNGIARDRGGYGQRSADCKGGDRTCDNQTDGFHAFLLGILNRWRCNACNRRLF